MQLMSFETKNTVLKNSSIIKTLFDDAIELLPSVAELFELELAYLEFLSLEKADLLERSAYIKRFMGEYSKHYLMYQHSPDCLMIDRSAQTKNYFEEGQFSTGYATHGLFPYRGKFHPQLVKALINIIGIQKGEVILDPMCGSGTTNIEAALMGVDSYAVDMSPFCRFMTDVKFESLTVDIDLLHKALSKSDEFFEYFTERKEFTSIKNMEKQKIYKLVLLSFLDALGYSKRVTKTGHRDLFLKVLKRYVSTVSEFISQNSSYLNELGKVMVLENSDAKKLDLESDSIDGVITSPPYSFAIDYLQNDKSQLEYLGYDLDKLRPNMVGLRGKNVKEKLDNYFSDMDIICSEISRILKPSKYLVMIIGSNTNQTGGIRLENTIVEICKKYNLLLARSILKPIKGMRNTMKEEYILFFQRNA